MVPSPSAATISSAAALAEELARYRVVPEDRLCDLQLERQDSDAASFAELLVSRGELTRFQVQQALQGAARILVLGPYRIVASHFSTVLGPTFCADKSSKPFALRVLPLRSLWQAKQAKQLVRSLNSFASHPIIVPLVDVDSANGMHYLAWPLVEGQLLADRIHDNGPLLPGDVAALLAHLAAGLAACHSAQVCHGLLCPRAVAVGNGVPRLLETGAGMLLARNLAAEESFFDTLSTTTALSAARDFAAPELLADPTDLTPAVDQYALGALGVFALTGLPPNGARVADSLLGEVLQKLLQPNPADRFSAMDEVHALLADLAGLSNDMSKLDASAAAFGARSANAGELPGNLQAWKAPLLPRPADRDDSDASIQFDLPHETLADPEIDVGKDANVLDAAVDTPLPNPRTSPALLPPISSERSPVQRESRAAENARQADALPLLPVAPLVTDASASKASGSWSTVSKSAELPAEDRPSGSVLWKKMKRKVLFWQSPGDTVQVSVFGPTEVTHSQAPKFVVYLHSPSVEASVGTLARAFHHDVVLLGTCRLAQEIHRGTRLDVHLAVEHAAVTNPLDGSEWQGHPKRIIFDLVIPWEAPIGNALAIVSIGKDDVRIGKVEFPVPILDKPLASYSSEQLAPDGLDAAENGIG